MKIYNTLSLFVLLLGLSSASAAEKVLSNILVTGHGGVLRVDLVADKVKQTSDSITMWGLRYETAQGEVYVLRDGLTEHSDLAEKNGLRTVGSSKESAVAIFICKVLAPKGSFVRSWAKSAISSDEQSITLIPESSQFVVSQAIPRGYGIRTIVMCSKDFPPSHSPKP